MRIAEPRVVRKRRERLEASRVRGGLTVNATAALRAVGFTALGEVMGAVAVRAPYSGFFTSVGGGTRYPRGWQGEPGGRPPPVFSSTAAERVPSAVTTLREGYRTALARLVDDVRARGGDGAVGVRVEHTSVEALEDEVWQFLATGTAVRGADLTRARTPFTAALSPTGTAAALRAGWVPVSYLSCPVMTARWVDDASRRGQQRRAPNAENVAFTEAVNRARQDAARELARAAERVGADAVVLGETSFGIAPVQTLAQVSVRMTGTALARFANPPAAPPLLPVMTLGGRP